MSKQNLLSRISRRGPLLALVMLSVGVLGVIGLRSASASTSPMYAAFYRLYSPSTGDHFYTTDWNEAVNAFNNLGYKYEWVAAYVSPSWQVGLVPFYRLHNPSTGDHFYTTNWNEAANALNNLGYKYEEVAAYVAP